MGIRMLVENVTPLSDGVWSAQLTPSEVRMFVRAKTADMGQVNVLGVWDPEFDKAAGTLSFDIRKTYVLNIGRSDKSLIVDLGAPPSKGAKETVAKTTINTQSQSGSNSPRGRGDSMFIASCRDHLEPHLVSMAERLLSRIRSRYHGELHEGKARKWVNHPENFVAITIQNRDQSFAIYVKGKPDKFFAPTLDIKEDRPGYSRFKLKEEAQLKDAISVILASAKETCGY